MSGAAMPSSVLVVLHVETHSGPQRSLGPRLEYLRARGARITTLVPAPGPAAAGAAQLGEVLIGAPGALIVPRGSPAALRVPATLRAQARAVRDAVRAAGADLAIVSSALMPGSLAGARRAGAGVVLYAGELLDGGRVRGLAAGALARFSGWCADAVIANSRAVADCYERRGVRTIVVHPPIDPPSGADGLAARGAELRRRLGIAPRDRLVCSLGAITEGRGQDALVEALAASIEHGNGWRLVVAGEPYRRPADVEFAARLRGLVARLDLGERVVLAGGIDDPDALYAAADVFVNPARADEAFGRASCEALAARCPVVSTRVGGALEALREGETALVVEPGSPAALATAIERLLGEPALAERLAGAGAEDVARRFAPAAEEPLFSEAVEAALAARAARSR